MKMFPLFEQLIAAVMLCAGMMFWAWGVIEGTINVWGKSIPLILVGSFVIAASVVFHNEVCPACAK